MHPYKLGYHLKFKRLCRIPFDYIPENCVRIIKYREHIRYKYWRDPYDFKTGELLPNYWSIYRWIDLERMK